MDQGTLGAISTVLVAIAFVAVCWWAFSPRRKKRFDDAANLPFADEDQNGKKPESSGFEEEAEGSEEQTEHADHRNRDETDRRN
ncbi:cbb3-type cytochrome oxidase subunit 3 [Marinimicrobium locisalis]|uniref:cbb3-type cytochrome oxidase subunit 3 n=1 Tax=Marinimicrobium locisalis TaxID=546022 RepID=UPI0032216511